MNKNVMHLLKNIVKTKINKIHCFKNRKILLSKIDECPICFDRLCTLYVNIVRCPICRVFFTIINYR